MRVVQLVAADRWTGAAATALQLAEALRGAGVDCAFVFRPGRGLEQRLAGRSWALPVLAKERSPGDVVRSVRIVRRLVAGADVAHVHLPHDHLLVRLALRGLPSPPLLVRSVHHPGHLRRDPFHEFLFRRAGGFGVAHAGLGDRLARWARPVRLLPVALDARFRPGGDRSGVRRRLGIPADVPVAGVIGKIVPGRGFDVFIRGLAAAPAVWGLIVGKEPPRPSRSARPGHGEGGAPGGGDPRPGGEEERLRALAAEHGVAGRLAWAGYVDDGLEDLYAAMDLFVFAAAGSDHAHRAIAEAAACGVPALGADIPGVRGLVEAGTTGDLWPAGDSGALAAALRAWAAAPARRAAAGTAAAARATERWTPSTLAAAAASLYAACGVATE